MKRTLTITIVAAVLLGGALAARPAQATEVGYGRKFGLGVVLGDPTGLSAKLWVAPTNAIDFGLGWWGWGVNNGCWVDNIGRSHCDNSFSGGTFNADYLWQSNIVRGTAQLDWHIGAGGRFIWWGGCSGDCVQFGARVPIGLDLMFQNPNFLEVFFELAPALMVVPGVFLAVEGGLGVRGYF
jgi:hypothetical protein